MVLYVRRRHQRQYEPGNNNPFFGRRYSGRLLPRHRCWVFHEIRALPQMLSIEIPTFDRRAWILDTIVRG